jgi:hypothetical protein
MAVVLVVPVVLTDLQVNNLSPTKSISFSLGRLSWLDNLHINVTATGQRFRKVGGILNRTQGSATG